MTADAIFPRFSDAEYRRRYAAVRAEMAKRGIDAVIAAGDSAFRFSNHANVQWLTNWLDPYAAYAVITLEQDPILVISNPLYLHTARRASVATEIHGVYTPGKTMGERLTELGLGSGTIGLAGVRNVGRASMAFEHQRDLTAAMPNALFVDALDVMQEARRIKSAEEIGWFEKGAEYTDRAVMAIDGSLREDMPEFELSARIQESFLDDGGSLMFHFLGATPMTAPELIFPWQYPSTRRTRAGDVLLTEISVGHWGYAGQVQRAYTVNAAPTAAFQRLHDTAVECYQRIFEALKPGASERDILDAARFVERQGYKTLDVLIHGWGITIEPPRADLSCAMIKRECLPFTVEEGMLFVIQPHIVSGDETCGVQVGNLVCVDGDGARSLQKAPMDFFQIAKRILEETQKLPEDSMLTRRAFTASLASVGVTMLSVHQSRGQSLPTIRLGNAAGIVDPQLIFMTMGQHPKIDYYKQEGCALDIINMSGSGQTMQAIIAGHVETSSLAPIAYLPVFAKNPNVDVVYVYAWLRSPHWGVAVKPDSAIKSLQDLKGKNIGIRNKGDTGYFGAVGMLKEIGIDPDKDVEWISVDQGGPAGDALYRGRVDAMAFWDGGFARMETAGFKLRYLPNSPGMQQLFGQAYCVRRSDFKKNRDVYVRFFRAMAKSTVFAYADTDLAIKLHWDLYPETKPKGKTDQEAMAEARVVVNSRREKWMPAPWQADKRFGAMNADEWRAQLKFLGLEGTVPSVDPIFTADILDDVNNFDRDKVLALVKTLSS